MIRLLADIGGTHARFTLAQDGQFNTPSVYENRLFRTVAELFARVRQDVVKDAMVKTATLAVAGHVTGDAAQLTNRNWTVQCESAAQSLGIQHVELINDLAALARGVPQVPSDALLSLTDNAHPAGPIAVIGVGTGIGTATLLDIGHRRHVLAAEGGHVSLPLADATFSRLILDAVGEFELEAETLLSAPGLLRVYSAVARRRSTRVKARTPEDVTALVRQADPVAGEAFQVYTQLLGLFARNLALSVGATGGVYFAGAVLRELASHVAQSNLMVNFASGRQRRYLDAIPVILILDELVTFRGLAA